MREFNENNMQVIEIEDYTSVEEYADLSTKINLKDVAFNIIWNTERQCINKGFIFVFRHMGKLYNILVDEGLTSINEKTFIEDETEERVLRIDFSKEDYYYAILKHNSIKSTTETKIFSKDNSLSFDPVLPSRVALEEVTKLVENLQGVDGIENVVSIEKVNETVISDLKNRIEPSI